MLLSSDGTPEGTGTIVHVSPYTSSSNPLGLTNIGEYLVAFYPGKAACVAPMTTTIILPNYVPPGEYRLRLVTSWDAPGLRIT